MLKALTFFLLVFSATSLWADTNIIGKKIVFQVQGEVLLGKVIEPNLIESRNEFFSLDEVDDYLLESSRSCIRGICKGSYAYYGKRAERKIGLVESLFGSDLALVQKRWIKGAPKKLIHLSRLHVFSLHPQAHIPQKKVKKKFYHIQDIVRPETKTPQKMWRHIPEYLNR